MAVIMNSAVCLGYDTALVNVYQRFRVTFRPKLQDATLTLKTKAINSLRVIIVHQISYIIYRKPHFENLDELHC
jgi:hypothetical protein